MSRYLLRQTRLTHALRAAFVPVPPRRCYSALASHQLPQDQGVEVPQAETVAHSVTEVDLTSARSAVEENDAPLAEPATRKKGQRKKKTLVSKVSDEAAESLDRTRRISKVEEHLASIKASGLNPTIEDLDNCRPASCAPSNSPQYVVDYNALVDTLCRSFSKAQLLTFLEMRKVGGLSWRGKRKVQYAEAIIEMMWGWPSLKEVERAKRDQTEVSVESFPVTPSQMFLLLGRDGADLLEMSSKFNVHISLTTNPLALQVEGLRASLERISKRIEAVEQGIISETLELPTKTPVRSDMVQRISRLAGAYLENVDMKGNIRIYARNSRSLDIAKRLASRAAHELNVRLQPPTLIYLPSEVSASTPVATLEFPHSYSLYPFLSPRSLPWTMNMGGSFRVRRVGEWLGNSLGEDIANTGGLAGDKGRILVLSGGPVDLKTTLLNGLPNIQSTEAPSRTIKASTGHMLFTTSSLGQRPTIIPPLKGHHTFSKLLQWMSGHQVQSSFVPSLPAALVDSSPSQQKILHRLTYRALPNPDRDPNGTDTPSPTGVMTHTNRVIAFEVVLAQPRTNTLQPRADPLGLLGADVPLLGSTAFPYCSMGCEVVVNLMMPDRPMDLSIIASDSSRFATGKEPEELQAYFANLRTFMKTSNAAIVQPDPPLLFDFLDDTYMLHTSAMVRQSAEIIKTPVPKDGNELNSYVRAVSESILDLESNQKATRCELACDDYLSDIVWKRFLSDCDRLTSMRFKPVGNIATEQTDDGGQD